MLPPVAGFLQEIRGKSRSCCQLDCGLKAKQSSDNGY